MSMMENFYSKSGLTLKQVAEELLFYEPDERIPRISDLAEKFQVGRGTVQSALKILEETQSIRLESRGHLGTFLREKCVSNLLKFSGVDRILAVMPLPYSKKYEGLASGLASEFSRLNLAFNIAFMRGAKPRLEGVKEGRYDFAIVSRFSALEEMKNHDGLKIALSFGKQTYVSKHAVIFSDPTKKRIEDKFKIGIDTFSNDQKFLTYAEAEGKNVEYVEMNYMHLLQHLKANTIDATIWSIDEIDTTLYHVEPLTSKKAIQYEREMSEAVCVIRKGNRKVEYILQHLSKENIVEIQKGVERGDIMPKY
jgi:hypothetical protein